MFKDVGLAQIKFVPVPIFIIGGIEPSILIFFPKVGIVKGIIKINLGNRTSRTIGSPIGYRLEIRAHIAHGVIGDQIVVLKTKDMFLGIVQSLVMNVHIGI